MNRRGFLGALSAVVGAIAAAPSVVPGLLEKAAEATHPLFNNARYSYGQMEVYVDQVRLATGWVGTRNPDRCKRPLCEVDVELLEEAMFEVQKGKMP